MASPFPVGEVWPQRLIAGNTTLTLYPSIVAIAKPVGNPVLAWQATERLGIGTKVAARAA
jgi:hypothetical protein